MVIKRKFGDRIKSFGAKFLRATGAIGRTVSKFLKSDITQAIMAPLSLAVPQLMPVVKGIETVSDIASMIQPPSRFPQQGKTMQQRVEERVYPTGLLPYQTATQTPLRESTGNVNGRYSDPGYASLTAAQIASTFDARSSGIPINIPEPTSLIKYLQSAPLADITNAGAQALLGPLIKNLGPNIGIYPNPAASRLLEIN
jgi:hypothetical protein